MRTRFDQQMLVLGLAATVGLGTAAQDADEPESPPPMRDRALNDAAGERPDAPPTVRLPPGVEFVQDVIYATVENGDGSDHDLAMNVFFPKANDELLPAIIYMHGGGFVQGDRNIGNQPSAILAQGGYFACTISYRLIDKARLPAAMHDAKAAVRFLRANAEELGIDPDRIGVWGHSAGGHLAAYLGTTGNNPETHGEVGEFDGSSSDVACVVDFFGTSDLVEFARAGSRTEQMTRRLLGAAAQERILERLRRVSPITWIDAGDPPFLIIHGDQDRVVPIEQSQLLDAKLRESGIPSELIVVEGAGHGVNDTGIMIRAVEFFDTHLGGAAAETVRQVYETLRQRESDRRPSGRE